MLWWECKIFNYCWMVFNSHRCICAINYNSDVYFMIISCWWMKVRCEFPMIVGLEAFPPIKSITSWFVSLGILIFLNYLSFSLFCPYTVIFTLFKVWDSQCIILEFNGTSSPCFQLSRQLLYIWTYPVCTHRRDKISFQWAANSWSWYFTAS